jgi:hypothetical protein
LTRGKNEKGFFHFFSALRELRGSRVGAAPKHAAQFSTGGPSRARRRERARECRS